jgi:hypothetical protein
MALSYRKYTATNLAPQLVTSNVIDPNTILGLHQGSNGFANLIICIAEAWYLESIRELAKNNRSAIIDDWQKRANLGSKLTYKTLLKRPTERQDIGVDWSTMQSMREIDTDTFVEIKSVY